MPAEWVKMVHRTQTSHLPDPYDPTPVAQGIPVFYGSMLYGGVSFAIIEDRKWKSAPQTLLPKANIVNGWPQNPAYNAAEQGDVNGAVLLGNRQLDFLEDWALDWGNGAWMKCIISQTLFGNLATLPAGSKSGAVIPSLKVLAPGEYAENDQVVMDHDSNGWPQSGRNNALIAIRRGFAVHLCGDQHLGSTVQYGVDAYRDAGFALCVPSVANIWPRRWFPPTAGVQRRAGAAKYTGNFKDGFGNLLTVHAVSNPHSYGGEPTALMNRAPGYGIVHFRRSTRKITMTNWPRWIDPSQPGAKPYPGWPVNFDQLDNYRRRAAAFLPEIIITGIENPVLQVVDDDTGEMLYAIRLHQLNFTPKVFAKDKHSYTVYIGEPGEDKIKILEEIEPVLNPRTEPPILVEF
jgi:hypothetical protein